MNTLPTLSLDEKWTCAYFEDKQPNEDVTVPWHLHSLLGWSPNVRAGNGLTANLFHRFDLEPTDFCVRYTLHVESAPGRVKLQLNARQVGEFDGSRPFAFDVTDYVVLEHNYIGFQIDCNAAGKFGAVYLEQVPCE